jgi:peptide/nickel transport system permease protein
LSTYIIRRLIQTLITLIILSFICFLLIRLIPGDPVQVMLGPTAPAEQIAQAREYLGLDKPLIVQYASWLANALRGDLGTSIRYGYPVTDLFIQRLPITAYLSLLSLILSTFLGIFIGILSALRRGSFLDQGLVVLATIGVCIPIFWLGIIGVLIFGLYLHWLPIQGWVSPTVDFWKSARYAIIPVILLAIPSLAVVARQTRSSMLEVIHQDYIRTAWSKGLRERVIVLRHALKNALIPIITLLGLQVRILFGGSVLVETVLNIPGMGRLLVDSAFTKDYFVLQGGVLIMGIAVCLVNLLVDISYTWIDPRIRYE